MERPIAKKTDWKVQKMPLRHTRFTLKRHFEAEEIANLRFGNIPQEMEDKWFVYMEGDVLYAHRSWTGACIYVVKFDFAGDKAKVTLNRRDYQGTPESAKETLNSLLDYWVQPSYDYYQEFIDETAKAAEEAKQ